MAQFQPVLILDSLLALLSMIHIAAVERNNPTTKTKKNPTTNALMKRKEPLNQLRQLCDIRKLQPFYKYLYHSFMMNISVTLCYSSSNHRTHIYTNENRLDKHE